MRDIHQRRSSSRRRFACLARFRDAHTSCSSAKQTYIITDLSCDGLYFIAQNHGLREGGQLTMHFPDIPEAQQREYLVKIIRMNSLPDDRWGVGARMILLAIPGG